MKNKKHKGTVLYPPSVPWDVLKQRPHHLCEQFALDGYNVIFCNGEQTGQPDKKINDNLTINYNFNEIIEKVKKGNLVIDIYYFSWGYTKKYIDILKPKVTIFDSLDIFKQNKTDDEKAIAVADIVLCTSKYIYDIRKKEHKNVYLVRNACDSRMLDSKEDVKPTDIEGDSVGLVGALGEWVSTSLLKKVGLNHETVFIGREFPKLCPSTVKNLGHKDHNLLGSYYRQLSVGLIPFNTKLEVIQACNPIKMYEYLSCGVPVVSTKWSETDFDSELVITVDYSDQDGFIKAIERAKQLKDSATFKCKARKFSLENTWEVRYQTIKDALSEFRGGAIE